MWITGLKQTIPKCPKREPLPDSHVDLTFTLEIGVKLMSDLAARRQALTGEDSWGTLHVTAWRDGKAIADWNFRYVGPEIRANLVSMCRWVNAHGPDTTKYEVSEFGERLENGEGE